MSISEKYRNQVSLLLEIMPYVAKEPVFALKGGSAINMFYNNIPRLSVDLDLVYLPIDEHTEACKNINSTLGRITDVLRGAGFQAFLQGYKDEKKIICSNENATVKIEPNYTIRGILFQRNIQSWMNISADTSGAMLHRKISKLFIFPFIADYSRTTASSFS